MSLRVLHLMASGEQGGGADHLVGLLPELERLGVACEAVSSAQGPLLARLSSLGLRASAFEMMQARADPRIAWGLRRLVAERHVDLVHCHGTRAAFYAAMARLPFPTVYTVHGLAFRQHAAPWRRCALGAAEVLAVAGAQELVSVSAADLALLRRWHCLDRQRGTHIPNAVDAKRFFPGSNRVLREEWQADANTFVIGTVARLVPQKAVDLLVAAAATLPRTLVVVAGDGPLRDELERRAYETGAPVRFLGARDDIPEFLRALDLFVLPSRWEGEPIALIEAMASGLPCVAAANEGARELLEHNQTGWLFPVGDAGALAAACLHLQGVPEERQRLAGAARAKVASRSWAAAAAALLPVYRAAKETQGRNGHEEP